MHFFKSSRLPVALGAAAIAAFEATGVAYAQPASEGPFKQFTQSDRANPRLAKKFGIPAFMALPDSARIALPDKIPTTDILVDFRHPDNRSVGLRVIETSRSGMAERLAKTGIFQTGDLILSFWPEWGGAGPYPNVQMGVSHVGIAYIKDGKLNNFDMPLNTEYNSPPDLRSPNYREVFNMHVIRPRNLTAQQRDNLQDWITRFDTNKGRIYPTQLIFNPDYNAPKYKAGEQPDFVKRVAQTALGQAPGGAPLGLYCSEFAWAVLSLRDCDPDRAGNQFSGNRIPSCVREPMQPMMATGDYMMSRNRRSNAGLADGPLMVIDQMNLEGTARTKMIESVFKQTRRSNNMSVGHRAVAKQMEPKFKPLELYYNGVYGGAQEKAQATAVSTKFRAELPQNYSPTSFLINTLLPSDSTYRTMDYVATIVVK